MEYKVTVYVMTPYHTLVWAKSEKKAIEIALEREGPSIPAYLDETAQDEWVASGLEEFPNLGKDETPDVEEV